MQRAENTTRERHAAHIAALKPQQVGRVAVRGLRVEPVRRAPVQHARAHRALQTRADVGGALAQGVGPGALRAGGRQRHVRVRDLAGLVRQRGRFVVRAAAEVLQGGWAVELGRFSLWAVGFGRGLRGIGVREFLGGVAVALMLDLRLGRFRRRSCIRLWLALVLSAF